MQIRKNLFALLFATFFVQEEANAKKIVIDVDEDVQKVIDSMKGLSISGQMTGIYQSSNLDLKQGDLKNNGTNLTDSELQALDHKDAAGSFSADLIVEKKFNDDEFLHFDLQFANGLGVDAPLQGGGMVNNDIMEDSNNHNDVYLAKAFYERTVHIGDGNRITFDIGKFGVNDFFDVGDENSDQTTQFLNQAIANNGAFDYVQDLEGHGYTYGLRTGIGNDLVQIDLGIFSSDSQLDNISDKYSMLAGLSLMPQIAGNGGVYQIYVFSNRGEYAAFDGEGNLLTSDVDSINTADNLNKNGFGISITQALSDKINMFAKYGKQDDDRDVRHYQDMDESYMVGANFSGEFWSRNDDEIGIAYEVGRLTGNHRKAHEKGYSGFFDRSGGVGAGNYDDETVLEAYYRYALNDHSSISLDAQYISNFYYSKVIGDVQAYAVRFNASF